MPPVTALSVALVLLVVRSSEPRLGVFERSAIGERAPDDVAAFTGEIELPGGGTLSVRLTPFQSAEASQSFAARALRARLGLAEGEPWRLELELDGGRAPSPALRGLSVRDAEGVALEAIPAYGTPAPDAPADPLRTLFAAPELAIEPGRSLQLVLWGRRPGEGARLAWDALENGAVELAQARVPRAALPRSLARLEPEAPEGDR